jgi:predicted Rossmann-fold nucleotide-binding protein
MKRICVFCGSKLGLYKKACGVLNVEGFYDSLLNLINNAVTEGFIRPENATLVSCDNKPSSLLKKLENWNPVIVDKWISKSES